jgi:hypothetical protein
VAGSALVAAGVNEAQVQFTHLDIPHCQVEGRATLDIDMPGLESQTNAAVNFVLGCGPTFSGRIVDHPLTLALAGVQVSLPKNTTLSDKGFNSDSASINLPAAFGGRISFTDILLAPDEIHLGSADGHFSLPDISFGDGDVLRITDNSATLHYESGAYQIAMTGSLSVRIPGSSPTTLPTTITLASGPRLKGSIKAQKLSLNLPGITFILQGMTLDNDGLKATDARLVMADALGSESAEIHNLRIDSDGITFADGSANFQLPDITLVDMQPPTGRRLQIPPSFVCSAIAPP